MSDTGDITNPPEPTPPTTTQPPPPPPTTAPPPPPETTSPPTTTNPQPTNPGGGNGGGGGGGPRPTNRPTGNGNGGNNGDSPSTDGEVTDPTNPAANNTLTADGQLLTDGNSAANATTIDPETGVPNATTDQLPGSSFSPRAGSSANGGTTNGRNSNGNTLPTGTSGNSAGGNAAEGYQGPSPTFLTAMVIGGLVVLGLCAFLYQRYKWYRRRQQKMNPANRNSVGPWSKMSDPASPTSPTSDESSLSQSWPSMKKNEKLRDAFGESNPVSVPPMPNTYQGNHTVDMAGMNGGMNGGMGGGMGGGLSGGMAGVMGTGSIAPVASITITPPTPPSAEGNALHQTYSVDYQVTQPPAAITTPPTNPFDNMYASPQQQQKTYAPPVNSMSFHNNNQSRVNPTGPTEVGMMITTTPLANSQETMPGTPDSDKFKSIYSSYADFYTGDANGSEPTGRNEQRESINPFKNTFPPPPSTPPPPSLIQQHQRRNSGGSINDESSHNDNGYRNEPGNTMSMMSDSSTTSTEYYHNNNMSSMRHKFKSIYSDISELPEMDEEEDEDSQQQPRKQEVSKQQRQQQVAAAPSPLRQQVKRNPSVSRVASSKLPTSPLARHTTVAESEQEEDDEDEEEEEEEDYDDEEEEDDEEDEDDEDDEDDDEDYEDDEDDEDDDHAQTPTAMNPFNAPANPFSDTAVSAGASSSLSPPSQESKDKSRTFSKLFNDINFSTDSFELDSSFLFPASGSANASGSKGGDNRENGVRPVSELDFNSFRKSQMSFSIASESGEEKFRDSWMSGVSGADEAEFDGALAGFKGGLAGSFS
ncbi:hypothetical protein HK102_006218 [Quaeritorhiza haematococci]|nr:hypothetical protein HK102_006218 [Quaeritorhiza haematococci]